MAKDTLHSYLSYLEDAFLVRTLAIATESERRRMVNPRKAYPVDPGLIPVFDRSGKANLGHSLETAAALQLERSGAEISYAKTDSDDEVDFLARHPDGREELIQVCVDLDSDSACEREVRALLQAERAYPRASRHIIALNADSTRELPRGITVHSASAWLLDDSGGR